MHFFSPVHKIRCYEVMHRADGDDVTATALPTAEARQTVIVGTTARLLTESHSVALRN